LKLRRKPNRQTSICGTKLLSRIALWNDIMLTNTTAFDPETVSLLSAVLDQALGALPLDSRSQERKTLLASKLLCAASVGEGTPFG